MNTSLPDCLTFDCSCLGNQPPSLGGRPFCRLVFARCQDKLIHFVLSSRRLRRQVDPDLECLARLCICVLHVSVALSSGFLLFSVSRSGPFRFFQTFLELLFGAFRRSPQKPQNLARPSSWFLVCVTPRPIVELRFWACSLIAFCMLAESGGVANLQHPRGVQSEASKSWYAFGRLREIGHGSHSSPL